MPEIRMSDILKSFPRSPEEMAVMDEKEIEEYQRTAPQREEIHRMVVFGHDSRTHKGDPVEQGIGSRGRENMNHFQSVRRYEGEEAYWSEVARVWKDHPEQAEKLHKLGLPKPKKAA